MMNKPGKNGMKIHTIKSRSDFLRVQNMPELRTTTHNLVLVCRKMREELCQPSAPLVRFGFVITKKISKKAVVRNRLRRQLKAILQKVLVSSCNLRKNYLDCLLIARKNILDDSYTDLFQEVEGLVSKIEMKYGK
jgi:ribonuclease P protein component